MGINPARRWNDRTSRWALKSRPPGWPVAVT